MLKEPTDKNVLNAAIIGCGAIFENHAAAISGMSASRLCAVCDIDGKKAEEAAKRFNCRFFTDYKEMLKQNDIDVVHICTPHYLHAQMAIAAMQSGKHVLTEKPMAISVEDANVMNRIAAETNRVLGVCFQNRYNATSLKIKELIQSEKVGRILGAKAFVTWKREESYYTESSWRGRRDKEGGGVLINQSIHTLDLIQWFLGDIEWLQGHVDTRLLKGIIEVEDTADATIAFKNGSNCVFYATNNYAENSPIEIEIVCEKALIRLRDKLTISYHDGSSEEVCEVDTATGEKSYWGCSHRLLIKDFYEKLQKGGAFQLTGERGIVSIKMIEAINKSSETGNRIKV